MEAKGNGNGMGTTMAKNMDKTIDRVSDRAHGAVDRAAGVASSAAERIGDRVDALAARGEELRELPENWVEAGRDYVREHPVASLGIALAAGYLLSMIMRSK
jgi:ElaB/YqjD/DUF883 family membrane-anchored ribosome-binding protein